MTEDAVIRQMSRDVVIQRLAKRFREEMGTPDIDVDSEAFTDYLLKYKVQAPRPRTERELLAQVAKKALKHEVRHDSVTGNEYRGWHAVQFEEDTETGQLRWRYYDIDHAPRFAMEKSAAFKIRSMVHDGVRVALDVAHWNRINAGKEEPIDVTKQLDLRLSVGVEMAARELDRQEDDDDHPTDDA